ncbi:hypothetical protein L1987_20763 [Smallanthus sonchifolius]|uniref:Uncharacterized protein n=1 Tax=Smallanthus sonchifolius TaxID=185202 RepID=A0ACB9IVH3_9ASTR|nr:hypothetical protein L1987_20763 [Smallanthus sonchifolius]
MDKVPLLSLSISRMIQKKKTQVPLIATVVFLFVLCTIFYNERRFQEINRKENRKRDDIGDVKESFSSLNSKDPSGSGILDRFSTCNSTVKYNGPKTPLLQSDEEEKTMDSCNVFWGTWVFDNVSFPLYNESDCPYMSDQLACHKHGRPDLMYQNWRWQPHDCNLKRWNATEMWDKLRGKRLMFVGDSLNRGQWISMLCLLESVIPAEKKSITPNAPLTIFRAEEYNATVEFQWAPLIVESNADDPVNHRLDERIIRPDSVLRHASEWEHVDILVFNSYLWWRQGPVKLLWSNEKNGVCEEAESLDALELAMDEWAKWIESKVDPLKKKVFFVTMSPTHLWSREGDRERKETVIMKRLLSKMKVIGEAVRIWLQ